VRSIVKNIFSIKCRESYNTPYLYFIKQIETMKAKYIKIEVEKRYMGKEYINRFMHLLELLAPGKYILSTIDLLASIENKETQLTAAIFSDNPFKI